MPYHSFFISFTLSNLWDWEYEEEILLSPKHVIDACVYEISPHTYKMWYKDESCQNHTYAAISTDLYHWKVVGEEISDCPHEGPNVFELGGVKRISWQRTTKSQRQS